jgi:predicted PurR-regulated permease PerM
MKYSMTENRIPFAIRLASVLLGVILVMVILYVGREILIPLALSAFLALLIQPIVRFLMRHRASRVLSIIAALTTLILVILGVVVFCSVQVSHFVEEWPRLESKINGYVAQMQEFVEARLHIEQGRQIQMLKEGVASVAKSSAAGIGGLLMTLSSLTIQLFLVPIYIFLFLYYHDLWIEFFFRLASRTERGKVRDILRNAGSMVQQYLVGRAIETVIVTILNTVALLVLGIDYAVLFGLLAGLLNLIPFIGVVIGSILPMLMALVTKESAWYGLGVLGAFTAIQFIDNHVIMPFIVGGRVNINSLVALVALLVGAAIWGVIGMILSLPIVAILKVVFDHVEKLKPWGLVLGDAIPEKKAS